MLAAGPELRITGAAAQTRMVSVARIRLVSRKSTRLFKGIICDDISEFESYMPSHAVGSLWRVKLARSELLFARAASGQCRERAKLDPPISFHGLRHTYASLALMNGVPMQVVSENLGHADTRMVERHYGHLAPSHKRDAIRAGAARFGLVAGGNVRPLR